MRLFEYDYAHLVSNVLTEGEHRETRNHPTNSLFGTSLCFDLQTDGFPLLQGRKIFYAGVLGEFAALLRRPQSVEDFEKFGCNYWKTWADENGKLVLDYGNAWFDFNGVDQIAALRKALKTNPTDRRMIVSAWRPDRLDSLSLPCCHYSYQFYVRGERYLDMVWTQRSVDVMVGLPSDMVLAAVWLITLANEVGLEPGQCKMDFGDTHIYQSHRAGATEYLDNALSAKANGTRVTWRLHMPKFADFTMFEPSLLDIDNYNPMSTIKFDLHG